MDKFFNLVGLMQFARVIVAVCMKNGPRIWMNSFLFLLVLWRFGLADDLQQFNHNVITRFAFGLGLEVRADTVAQNRNCCLLDIVNCHTRAAIHRCERLSSIGEKLSSPRSCSPVHQTLDDVRSAGILWSGCANQLDDEFFNEWRYINLLHQLLPGDDSLSRKYFRQFRPIAFGTHFDNLP